MKKTAALISLCMLLLLPAACAGQQRGLVDMRSVSVDGKMGIVWEDRTYVIFCVVSKNDRGKQIGYVDGDTGNRISEYKGCPPEEWLISWLSTDGGAILLKEQSVVDIPDGLEAEY